MPWTILSLNTHGGVGPHRHEGKPYGLTGALTTLIGACDPDVVVLQEAYFPDVGIGSVQEVAARETWNLAFHSFGRGVIDPWPQIRPTGEGTGEIGIAIMSPHELSESQTLPLRTAPFDPVRDRVALSVRARRGDTELQVVGVHTTSRLPIGPPRQLKSLARQLPGPETAAVVVGDHNLWGPAVARCLPGWIRAVKGRTWPASAPHSQIDHILFHQAGPLRVSSGEILEPIGSDHLPILATLDYR